VADVFVSYKKEDRAIAQRVVEAIEAEGFTVWWDDDITPRESWDILIEREAEAAKALIVLWTPKSVASEWVRAEAKRGKDLSKLVPFMMQPCQLPLAFSMIQAADLSGWNGDRGDARWRRGMGWVADQCGQPRPVAPAGPAFPPRALLLQAAGIAAAAGLGWAAYNFWPHDESVEERPSATAVSETSEVAKDSTAVVEPPLPHETSEVRPPATAASKTSEVARDPTAAIEPPLPPGLLGEAERALRAFLAAPSNPACEGEAAVYFGFRPWTPTKKPSARQSIRWSSYYANARSQQFWSRAMPTPPSGIAPSISPRPALARSPPCWTAFRRLPSPRPASAPNDRP
jgi:hypothetical protein